MSTQAQAPRLSGRSPSTTAASAAWTHRLLAVLTRSRSARLLLAVSTGVLIVLSIAEYDLWQLAWLGLVPLMLAVERSPSLTAALGLGWAAGLATNVGGFSWLVDLIQRFGPLPRHWALVAQLLFCGYQGLVFAVFALGIKVLRSRLSIHGRRPLLVLAAPLVMVSCELVVPLVFPWNLAMTQAWLPPVIQLSEWTGPLGVTALLLMVNGAICDAIQYPDRRLSSPLVAGSVLLLVLGWGQVRIHELELAELRAPTLAVGIVQGNVGFDQGAGEPGAVSTARLRMLQDTSRAAEQAGAELTLWTETAYPYALPASLGRDFAAGAEARIRRGFVGPLIFGATSFDDSDPAGFAAAARANSAFLLGPHATIEGRYDKNELVPFGEQVPFEGTFPWLRSLRLQAAGHYSAGSQVTTFPLVRGGETFRLAPMICLEDILSGSGRRVGALHPHLLVNLSNDAWFGPTSEPSQHLALAVFRSVEQRVAMVRAANTGPSAIVSTTGRVLQKTLRASALSEQRSPEVLRADVPIVEGGHTFFAHYGNVFGFACLALVAVGLFCALRHGTSKR